MDEDQLQQDPLRKTGNNNILGKYCKGASSSFNENFRPGHPNVPRIRQEDNSLPERQQHIHALQVQEKMYEMYEEGPACLSEL